MNARYYDRSAELTSKPQLGQFISPDTLVPDATNVMDFNRYAYARGNPMKYNDPTGHNGISIEGQCECGGGLLPGEITPQQAEEVGLNAELTGPQEVSLINAHEAPAAPPVESAPLENAVKANEKIVAPEGPPAPDISASGTSSANTAIIQASPSSINFSQRSVGGSVNQYTKDMANGEWDWSKSGPIRVMDNNGQLVTYDNRRVMAAQNAGLEKIPVEVVEPDAIMPGSKRTWGQAFTRRFNDPRNVELGGPVPPQGMTQQPIVILKGPK